MKWTLLLLIVSFVAITIAIPPSKTSNEEMRLLQFSPDHKEWVPMSMVEKLICNKDVHFMDITDYDYPEEIQEIEALPLPVSPTRQTLVKSILPLVNVQYVTGTITALSDYYTRYYRSDTGVAAAKWLQSEYVRIAKEYGRTDVVVGNITNANFPQPNVIATIPGSGPNKDNIVILGGHLDSVGSTSTGRSPGADDDASGSSSVLEVFRVLLAAKYKPDFTIQFFGYAAEEGGLLGSQGIAQDYQKRNVQVYAALQLDMTGYTSTGTPSVGIVTDYTNGELNAFVRLLVSTYTSLVQSNKQCGYACSDHASWNRTGYRSAFPFETVSNSNIHTANDVIARLSNAQLLEFVKLGVGFAVELAGTVN